MFWTAPTQITFRLWKSSEPFSRSCSIKSFSTYAKLLVIYRYFHGKYSWYTSIFNFHHFINLILVYPMVRPMCRIILIYSIFDMYGKHFSQTPFSQEMLFYRSESCVGTFWKATIWRTSRVNQYKQQKDAKSKYNRALNSRRLGINAPSNIQMNTKT